MRHEPLLVDRVPVEAAAQVVVQPALGHFLQRVRRHLHGSSPQFGRRALQGGRPKKKIDDRGPGKLRRPAKSPPGRIMGLVEVLIAFLECFRRRLVQRGGCPAFGPDFPRRAVGRKTLQGGDHLVGAVEDFFALLRPVPGDCMEHRHKPRAPGPVVGWKIRAAKKRLPFGRQPHAHRPAAVAGGLLHIGHVHPVEIGPFLAIHLHGDEVAVEHRGDRQIFKRLVRHHVAPMAGRVADAEKNGLLLGLRLGQRRRAPGLPRHGIIRMLQEIGRFFAGEKVGHDVRGAVPADPISSHPKVNFDHGFHGLSRIINYLQIYGLSPRK